MPRIPPPDNTTLAAELDRFAARCTKHPKARAILLGLADFIRMEGKIQRYEKRMRADKWHVQAAEKRARRVARAKARREEREATERYYAEQEKIESEHYDEQMRNAIRDARFGKRVVK